jgi:hypothetical protein
MANSNMPGQTADEGPSETRAPFLSPISGESLDSTPLPLTRLFSSPGHYPCPFCDYVGTAYHLGAERSQDIFIHLMACHEIATVMLSAGGVDLWDDDEWMDEKADRFFNSPDWHDKIRDAYALKLLSEGG